MLTHLVKSRLLTQSVDPYREEVQYMTIDEKYDKQGNLIGWKIRVCVGREDNKQKWKTMLLKVDDPVFDELLTLKRKDVIQKRRDAIINSTAIKFEDEQKEEFASQQEAKAKNPNAVIIDKRKITLSQYVHQMWWNDIVASKPRPNTLSFYKYTSDNICSYFDTLPIDKQKLYRMDTRTVMDYINYLKAEAVGNDGKALSETTILRHWQTFRNIIKSALRDDYIQKDPCVRLKETDKPKTPKYDGGYLTAAQAQDFIKLLDAKYTQALQEYNNVKPEIKKPGDYKLQQNKLREAAQWKCLMNLLLQHGLRRGEAIGIRWTDLKTEKVDGKDYHTLDITQNVTPDASNDSKVHIGDPKTEGSTRTILIQPEVYDMLTTFKEIQESYLKNAGIDMMPSSYVFCKSGDPSCPMYPTAPTRWLSRFIENNHLPNVSPHDLRRTWATLANEAGINQKAIQYNMGHSDGSDVESRHYIKLTLPLQISALETMHSVFYGKAEPEEEQNKQA